MFQDTLQGSEAGSTRGITISLPRVEMLESSDAQTPSPAENHKHKQRFDSLKLSTRRQLKGIVKISLDNTHSVGYGILCTNVFGASELSAWTRFSLPVWLPLSSVQHTTPVCSTQQKNSLTLSLSLSFFTTETSLSHSLPQKPLSLILCHRKRTIYCWLWTALPFTFGSNFWFLLQQDSVGGAGRRTCGHRDGES